MKIFLACAFLSTFCGFISSPAAFAEKNSGSTSNQETTTESSRVRCHYFPEYLVAERDAEGGMGTDIIVKYRSGFEDNSPCAYLKEDGDFEIRNEWVQYFAGVKGDLLLLDSTTGPGPTPITIWDLKKREKAYVGSWADPVFQNGSVLYWEETGPAAKDNCPELEEWESHGLGGVIETKVLLDLSDFSVTRTTETRCSARQ